MKSYPPAPYAYCIFCDDVRNEANGKAMFIGIYNDAIVFPHAAPATMRQLCFALHYVEPIGFSEEAVKLQIVKSDQNDPLVTAEIMPAGPRPAFEASEEDGKNLLFRFVVPIPDPVFETDCTIKVQFVLGEYVITGGRVQVRFNSQTTT
jgi:hypothetical protein